MNMSVMDIDWQQMLTSMTRQGIKTAYEVLDHCHISEVSITNYGVYVTMECCAGTYESVIEPKFAAGIRFALMLQFKAHDVALRVVDLDRAFFYSMKR